MKRITLIIALIPFALLGQNKYIPATDKLAHMGAGYVLGTTVSLALRAKGMPVHKTIVWGIGTAMVAGIGKEIYDKKKGFLFDDGDAMSTIFGGLVGSATVAICWGDITFKQFKSKQVKL